MGENQVSGYKGILVKGRLVSKEHKENFWGDANRPDDGDGDRTIHICQDSELCTYKQQILLCNSRAQTKKWNKNAEEL